MRALARAPALWYLGISLGLPLAGGAPLTPELLEHALTVLAVSALGFGGWHVSRRRLWASRSTRPAAPGSPRPASRARPERRATA
jgi:hypothetical protein